MNNSKPPFGSSDWYEWVEREAGKEFSRMVAPIVEKYQKEKAQNSQPEPKASEPKAD
jgi:hypothetical protein